MATAKRISVTEAKQRLGELVKRTAYGGERFVLEFRGKPQAAIVSQEDLERLLKMEPDWGRGREALERLKELRERIKARTGVQPDSAEEVRRLREERDDQLLGLR